MSLMKVSENCQKELFYLSDEQICNSTAAQNIWKISIYCLKDHSVAFKEVTRSYVLGTQAFLYNELKF